MKAIIDKMRADFVLLSEHRLATGEWTQEGQAEIGQAIKQAIESGDQVQIAMWSRWLADLACWVTAWRMICAPIEEHIRLAIDKARRSA